MSIRVDIDVVKSLPTNRPLVTGTIYKVEQPNGKLKVYTVNSNGEPIEETGMSVQQENKLDGLKTQAEITTDIENSLGEANQYTEDYTYSKVEVEEIAQKESLLFDTVADFRSMTTDKLTQLTSGKAFCATLLGYYTKGDTPAPINYFISTTSASDDGGSVFDVSGVKFEHDFSEEVVDIRYYGCKSDGVFDNVTKLNYLATKGWTIKLPKGITSVSDTVKLRLNTTLIGEGMNYSILQQLPNSVSPGQTSDGNFLVELNGSHNVTIKDLHLDANGFNQEVIFRNSVLNLMAGTDNLKIENVKFSNAFDTPYLGGFGIVAWYGGAKNVTINNVVFDRIMQSDLGLFEGENWNVNGMLSTNNGYMPINIETSMGFYNLRNINIDNVTIHDCARSAISVIYNNVGTGLLENVNISNINVVRGSKTDAFVGGIRFRGGRNVNINNVNFYDLGGTAIRMTVDSGQSVENVNISNVNVYNINSVTEGYGVTIEGTAQTVCKDLTFSNINLNNTYGSGFIAGYTNNLTLSNIKVDGVKSSERAVQINNSDRIFINNLKISNINSAGIGVGNSTNVIINGNIVRNVVGNGIYIQGTSNNISVTNNTIEDTRSTKLTTGGVRFETTLSGLNPRIYVMGNNGYGIANPIPSNIISYQSSLVKDNVISLGNVVGDTTVNATVSVRGSVLLATAQANISQADLVSTTSPVATLDTASTATDVAGLLTDLNDLISRYNVAVVLINELKTKYDLNVVLTNAIKTSQNTELTNQRTAGQQSAT